MPHGVVVLGIVALLMVAGRTDAAERSQTACVCRCCYRGDCTDIPGTAIEVDSCSSCDTARACQGVVEATRELMGTGQGAPTHACLALATLERASGSCDSATSRCVRSTTLAARCVDRGGRFQKATCVLWLLLVFVVLGKDVVRRWALPT
jgi:hypothetical protein